MPGPHTCAALTRPSTCNHCALCCQENHRGAESQSKHREDCVLSVSVWLDPTVMQRANCGQWVSRGCVWHPAKKWPVGVERPRFTSKGPPKRAIVMGHFFKQKVARWPRKRDESMASGWGTPRQTHATLSVLTTIFVAQPPFTEGIRSL